jgi:hypothetical protein
MPPSKATSFRIRAAGWLLVLAGAASLLLSGGFSKEHPLPFVGGVFLMIGGMILTSLSALIQQLNHMKDLKQRIEEKGRQARGGDGK